MVNVVLTASVGTSYDDLPEVRYHFPRAYLNQVKSAEGDFAIYYEPRRSEGGGRQAYFAMAHIAEVVRDPSLEDHFYVTMDGFLEFEHAVPFQEAGRYAESALQKEDGTTNKGAFGRSVRIIPKDEFEAILRRGFARELAPWEQMDAALIGAAEEQLTYSARPMIEQ